MVRIETELHSNVSDRNAARKIAPDFAGIFHGISIALTVMKPVPGYSKVTQAAELVRTAY